MVVVEVGQQVLVLCVDQCCFIVLVVYDFFVVVDGDDVVFLYSQCLCMWLSWVEGGNVGIVDDQCVYVMFFGSGIECGIGVICQVECNSGVVGQYYVVVVVIEGIVIYVDFFGKCWLFSVQVLGLVSVRVSSIVVYINGYLLLLCIQNQFLGRVNSMVKLMKVVVVSVVMWVCYFSSMVSLDNICSMVNSNGNGVIVGSLKLCSLVVKLESFGFLNQLNSLFSVCGSRKFFVVMCSISRVRLRLWLVIMFSVCFFVY